MSEQSTPLIHGLLTGVPGLDAILTGGLPEYSFNMIAGGPGTGKTTLAQQIVFANASKERPALYFTILGEPPMKLLRYLQQYTFFDASKVDGAVRYVDLSREVLEHDLAKVLASISREIEAYKPRFVVVDSFRTLVRASSGFAGAMELQVFLQRLALYLTSWQATTFLVGEYYGEEEDAPVFTVADGILWLSQAIERNSVVRKLRVGKMRGRAPMPGLHTMRITSSGVQVFPRIFEAPPLTTGAPAPQQRASTGVAGLDEMMTGGIPVGGSALVAGPAGSGKTLLTTQFVAEGAKHGESSVVAVFEEHTKNYIERAEALGFHLSELIRERKLKVIYMRPLDLSVDEALLEILDAVRELGAARVVIDSLSGFELALAPTFRDEFRESLFRLVSALTGAGVTILMTVEVIEDFTALRFSPHAISFLTDVIILLRYVEMDSRLQKVVTVAKLRHGPHSKELRTYEIGPHGLVVGNMLAGYRGILTGVPERVVPEKPPAYPGLTEAETMVLEELLGVDEARAEELGRRTGLTRPELTRALGRLVALNYALKAGDKEGGTYRAVGRALGEGRELRR